MRYLRKYESHEDIHTICAKYNIKDYTINDDESIDVHDSHVNLRWERLKKLPLKFKNVNWSFTCGNNQLTSLEGCPKSVGGDFYCHNNRLTNLEGCPKSVGGGFNCHYNEIDTFKGLDFVNMNDFYCHGNPIYQIWRLFEDHTKFEFFNDCDPIRENRVIILERLNFFLDYIGKDIVAEVSGYKCI
jgi:hypothetical protein